jgi:hypothetical protein
MLQGGTQQASEANSTVATAPGQNGAPSASPASSETQRYIAVVFDVLNLRHTNRMDFSSLFAGPRYLYVLSYSPAKVKADGSYHILKVNVMQRGFKVQARRGYFAPKPQKK